MALLLLLLLLLLLPQLLLSLLMLHYLCVLLGVLFLGNIMGVYLGNLGGFGGRFVVGTRGLRHGCHGQSSSSRFVAISTR